MSHNQFSLVEKGSISLKEGGPKIWSGGDGRRAKALNLLDFFGSFFHQGKNEKVEFEKWKLERS